MVFSEETVKAAWQRAGGRCECTRTTHGHIGRCNKLLSWENRGRESGRGAWETHHKTSVQSGGYDTFSNCEILCWDCHRQTHD